MSALGAAVDYIGRGWSPVPIPYMKKGPVGRDWPKLRITAEDAPKHFNGREQNIGIIMGEASSHLVDVDLDCHEALALASTFLPITELAFGRRSKRRSHWLYTSAVPKVIKFEDPCGAVDPMTGEPKATMLVEVRSTGGQTVFPGSTHESGEAIQWDEEGDPAEADPTQLLKAVGNLAAACLLVRASPAEGRHDYMLDICGALVRGLGADGAAHILAPVGRVVFGKLYNKTAEDRLIADTARKIAEGKPASGWPTLTKALGDKRARKVSDWLQLPTTQEPSGERPKAKAEPPIPAFYTEAELADLELPIPQYVIHEILTVGLYILAATPKLGKSWLNLAAGRAVATGTLFSGSRPVRQGPVLFLDLEGNQRRAQKRSAILRAGAAPSRDFHMIHTWPPMQAGGLELLERAIVEKGAVLAMIDVWACFRPPRPKNADPYQWDHESAKLVQEVAHRTNCAIVITHHNRKAEAEDFTAQVSGTAGLTGAADGIITLSRKRGEADAVMKATGRDIEERELALSFKEGVWKILGEAADVLMSKTRQSIHSTLHFAGKPMKPAEVTQAVGLKPDLVRQTLIRMLREGTVKADTSGRYTPAEPGQMQ